jgi:hypothetical protein
MINVIWYKACRGNWDSGLLCAIFEAHPDKFLQINTKSPWYCDRAIVIVTGCPEVEELRRYLDTIHEGIVILTSEEDSFFNWNDAIPKRFEIWTQYFSFNKQAIKERLLLGTPNRIKDYKINTHLSKKYLWSFVGQVQNPFREQCVEVLKNIPDGFVHIAGGFGGQGDGIEYQEYLDIMCQSVFVFCPAGSMCVDSFRLYEAMECGAIPITDRRAPRDPEDFNYWIEVYPANKLITVNSWSALGYSLLDIYDGKISPSNQWWIDYKNELTQKLLHVAAS